MIAGARINTALWGDAAASAASSSVPLFFCTVPGTGIGTSKLDTCAGGNGSNPARRDGARGAPLIPHLRAEKVPANLDVEATDERLSASLKDCGRERPQSRATSAPGGQTAREAPFDRPRRPQAGSCPRTCPRPTQVSVCVARERIGEQSRQGKRSDSPVCRPRPIVSGRRRGRHRPPRSPSPCFRHLRQQQQGIRG